MTTGKDLEQKFKKVFRHSSNPFPENFSLEDKAHYLKEGNNMLAAQAAAQREANIESKVSNIAEANKEIARRKAALAEEARENMAILDKRLEESNKRAKAPSLSNNPAKNASVAQEQPGKNGTPAKEVAQKVDNAAVNANLPKKSQAQGNKALDQSQEDRTKQRKVLTKQANQVASNLYDASNVLDRVQEARTGKARLNPEEHKEQQAQAPGLSNNTDKSKIEGRKEASAKNLQQALKEIDILNKTIEVTEQNKKALEKMVYKELEVMDKQQSTDLSNNTDKSKIEGRKEASAKNLQQALSNIDILNKTIEVTEQNKKALEKMVYKELEVMDKQQAKAPDLLKNLGKTESQESPKEGKGLFSKVIQGAIQIVTRMFRNVLPEEINDYRAENKDHSVAAQIVHGDNTITYNTSFMHINKREFKLEPGKDFHYQSEGVDIRITYNTQHTVPGAMNLNINGTEYNIQPGKFARYRNHGLEVDVVHVRQQGMDINQSQEVAGKDVKTQQALEISNIKAKTPKPSKILENIKVGNLTPANTPHVPKSSWRGTVV
ncbi:Hypothetical protein CINCED_3A011136 [Cinara cedri]|uniref:Uncharacterized protein n=1 Tax=Cinara cedri TaxID=506608 RepID=A0A5E4NG86_9HEMI|nr:Hypothetical protein CINCED_3A011136 [Cinara cedri]